MKKSALKEVVKKSFKTSKGSGSRKNTTNLETVIVASQRVIFTKCCQNQLFARNSMLASKKGQGFVRFAHEMFRYDIKST